MAALEEVQDQLGPDAVILSVRQVAEGPAWKPWQNKSVEVVAVPPGEMPEKTLLKLSGGENKKPAGLAPAVSEKDIHDLISRIASQLDPPQPERTGDRPSGPVKSPAPAKAINLPVGTAPRAVAREPQPQAEALAAFQPEKLPPVLQKAYRRLIAQGLDDELAQKVVSACADTLPPRAMQDFNQVKRHLGSQVEASLRVRAASGERVVCLIGASGSGKTSVTAKIAARAARETGKKIAWVCSDTVRAGAISEARAFTDSLGIALHLVYTPAELEAVLKAEKDADLILVDMPSCNPYNETDLVEMGEFLTILPNRATYWVVPATARTTDLKQALAAFSQFNLYGLILTKMDETRTFGDIANLAWRSKLPLVYFSTGVRVVEDLKPARAAELVSAIFAW